MPILPTRTPLSNLSARWCTLALTPTAQRASMPTAIPTPALSQKTPQPEPVNVLPGVKESSDIAGVDCRGDPVTPSTSMTPVQILWKEVWQVVKCVCRYVSFVTCQNEARELWIGCFVSSEECRSKMTFHILRNHVLSSDYLSDVSDHIAPLATLVGGMERGPTG